MSEDVDYYDAEKDTASFVFVRVIDGSVVDVYSFNTRVAKASEQKNGFYVDNNDATTKVTTVTKPVEAPAKAEEVVDVVEDADIPAVEID